MKKALSLILAVCLPLLMTACGSEPNEFDGTLPITTFSEDDPILADTSEVTTSETIEAEPSEDSGSSREIPVVNFTSDISAEGMLSIYEALGWTPIGKVATDFTR